MKTIQEISVDGRKITLETGRIAKQAHGSVLVRCGDTIVLVTACGTGEPRPGIDFFPLSVDYVEKSYAAGKIPGGFFKREGRLRDDEVLVSRLIDRPCRPLFPEGYRNDVQVIATVLSADKDNPPDVLALVGASAALHLSPIPWSGPIGGVRVGRIDGKFVINPTFEEIEKSQCDLVIAGSKEAIVMVEGECEELSEEDMVEALFFGHRAIQSIIAGIEELRAGKGEPKWAFTPASLPEAIVTRVREVAGPAVKAACSVADKSERSDAFKAAKKAVTEALATTFPEQASLVKEAYEDLKYRTMREQILSERRRVDGRDLVTVRPIAIETSLLPRAHGSALFTRGETQAIVTTTLGTEADEQRIEALTGQHWKRFLLHYNFPPFSVGEVKPMRGPGRREVGHGNLAERALARLLPSKEAFPYTIRLVSEITESNGSSSMATVCGGSLALMDAGVGVRAPAAGVAMGLIKEGERYAILTDILGDEDHLGDMDFKVCGTTKGVTAIQMDIKIEGLSREILTAALSQARTARLHVLEKMNAVMTEARKELSPYAPRIEQIKVKVDQIRLVIGPGGRTIRSITEATGATIDISEDGVVSIASPDLDSIHKAMQMVRDIVAEPELGKAYTGIVRRVEPYGAFLEIMPGKDGLLHISDLDWKHVESVEEYAQLGDQLEVKITDIDRDGRIRLSRKELLPKPEGYVERERPQRPNGGPRGDRDRGGRGGREGRGPRRDAPRR